MAIPHGITVEDVLSAIADFDAGVATHGFGPSRDYDLVFEGRTYPPKAIVGLAARRLNGGAPLTPHDFSGGNAPSGANRVLRELDFVVVSKGGKERIDWEDWEVALTVQRYFDLLHAEIEGQRVVKRQVYRDLAGRLRPERHDRPKAVELKFQNISAILEREGVRRVSGLSPMWNYQHALERAVVAHLDGPENERQRLDAIGPRWLVGLEPDSVDLEVQPPRLPWSQETGRDKQEVRRAWAMAGQDESNRRLGRKGEEWACDYERRRLAESDRPKLADQVEWVANTKGDGLGYDVISFHPDGQKLLLEVKTTAAPKSTPFLVTRNELRVWGSEVAAYQVFRIFDFGDGTHFTASEANPTPLPS